MELSSTLVQSAIWQSTLCEVENDQHAIERQKLRSSFVNFRERVAILAQEIRRDLPELTVHDISHLDALWEMGSLITGRSYIITPTEAYVLGGAILLHDLAMSVAATPGGYKAIRSDPRFKDHVVAAYHAQFGRDPTAEEILEPMEGIRRSAIFAILRQIHAESAEKLAFISYQSGSNNYHLIEDTELRQTFGRLIGQIAHSHWWSLSDVEKNFSRVIGAPPWAPNEWTVDPLKIACILRTADAAHLDARRAPAFLRAITELGSSSAEHWTFQEKLNKPYIADDALTFTSGNSFDLKEANAWWLCLETFRMVDRELRAVDSLLADRSMARFVARRVAGSDLPERLAGYVQTNGWLPINATIHISDLPHIIKSIGGEELYGRNPLVPIRELIQNASDAVRARRIFEERPADFGGIKVSIISEGEQFSLKVEDNGVGMSQNVLTDYLLDFGSSFWSSSYMHQEFPGLLSAGFEPVGRYGIGFFSVFMSADAVKVVTRRFDAAAKDTLVLEFGTGLSGRPILRPAEKSEQLKDGGTTVYLRLKCNPSGVGGMLHAGRDEKPRTLEQVCQKLALALDVNLHVGNGDEWTAAVRGSDWKELPSDEFIKRFELEKYGRPYTPEKEDEFLRLLSKNLRNIEDEQGDVVGRACVTSGNFDFTILEPRINGSLTVGGLHSSALTGICGVLVGRSLRASRDVATPLVSPKKMKEWADAQAELVPSVFDSERGQAACAAVIRKCGGYTGNLPIARNKSVWVSAKDIETMVLPDSILLLNYFLVDIELKRLSNLKFKDNVFVTDVYGGGVVFQGRFARGGFEDVEEKFGEAFKSWPSLGGAVLEAVIANWGADPEKLRQIKLNEVAHELPIGECDGAIVSGAAILIERANLM